MKQHAFGEVVAYVDGGSTLNAIVLQSTPHIVSGEEEEHLILAVPDPTQASAVMSGNQIQDSIKRFFGVRPLAKTKPVNDEAGTQGTGWAELADLQGDPDVIKAGALLTDLVHQINATNPVDAAGHDLKQNDKFLAAANHLGITVNPYDVDDTHFQIVQELQAQGVKHPASPKPVEVTDKVATPEVEETEGAGKSQAEVSEENQAMYDPTKAAEKMQPNDLNDMAQASHDAVERGELEPAAVNNNPETHPEFGNGENTAPAESEQDDEEDEPEHVDAEKPFTVKEESDGKFSIVDAGGNLLTDPATGLDEEYDSREEAEAALTKYNDDENPE